jgi:hypothetical protein
VRVLVNFGTGYNSAATTIVVDTGDAQDLVIGDVLLIETTMTSSYANEIVVVSAVDSTTQIQITRGQAGSTKTTLSDNTAMTKIGNVFEEGSVSPGASTRNPTKFLNYTQIFKTAYRITNTAKITNVRTGDPLRNDKKRKMFDHATGMELAWWFGKRNETTGTGGKPLRYSGGFLWFLSTYASTRLTAFTTTPTESTFLDAVYPIWDYDAGAGAERIAFCGNGALNSLNKLAKNSSSTRINFDGFVNVYGMRLQRWIFPQGETYLRTHPLFNTHAQFTNSIAIIDPSSIRYRYMRDTAHQDNIQANDADETKGQWLSECGLEFEHLKTMCWLNNFLVP